MSTTSNDKVIRKDNGQRNDLAYALRALAMDAVQQANSGHPGAPMGMAEMAVALWSGHLRHNPANPVWSDRDRFVLSNGHASMLLYGLLHLTGYDLPMSELRRFRRLHSKTPGHPEVGLTPGVETTTGPLGQGISNAVGFALAEKLLADEFNRPGHAIVNHHSYVFLGDSCLMEGISHEACTLAGVWQLNKLIALYDDNGIALHGGFIPYDGTFLTFSDYSRNAIRMAALMKQRVIHVFTHDSIGLGEDGPTHQPVEHAASLRLIPNLDVWRPCDAAETAVAWTESLAQAHQPSALLLSRQNLPAQSRTPGQVLDIRRGGYVLGDRADAVAVILATGSEVSLAMAAQQLLDARNIAARVVSLPSSTVFDRQDRAYRDGVLGRGVTRIGVEAGVTRWWGQYGCSAALGIDTFGESAPAPQVYEHFGLTADKLADLVQTQCDEERRHVRSSN